MENGPSLAVLVLCPCDQGLLVFMLLWGLCGSVYPAQNCSNDGVSLRNLKEIMKGTKNTGPQKAWGGCLNLDLLFCFH